MTPPRTGQLRYLSAADVLAALPPVEERLALARRAMLALVRDAELPPKIAVHPRPEASFAHAMPALLRSATADGSEDLLGMKWVAGYPTNASLGLPAIHGTVLLSDALTGVPIAILDAGPITAHRTAAVSGVAIRRWGPRVEGRATRVAMVGAGTQGHSHLPVVVHLVPDLELRICDRDDARARSLAEAAEASGARETRVVADPVAAVEGADLVITLVSFGAPRQSIPAAAFEPEATIVAVDYDMCVPAAVALGAALFAVDDRRQFLFTRSGPVFAGYPDPPLTIGEALDAVRQRPEGRVLVSHLGVGLADVVFGDAILRAAEQRGIGTLLDR